MATRAAELGPVYTPGKLYEDPAAPEGWIERTAGWVRDLGREPEGVKVGTISGDLTVRQGPQHAQMYAERAALAGELNTPQADILRRVFATGTPISIKAPGPERFRLFAPVLRKLGEGRYVAGLGKNEYPINAADDATAFDLGRDWVYNQRKAEIAATRDEAIALRDQWEQASRLLVDVWELLLRSRKYGLLQDDRSDIVAWENGSHDLYMIDAGEIEKGQGGWCYGMECSARIALAYYALALRDRKTKPAEVSQETAVQLLVERGLRGWKRQGNSFVWDGGNIDPQNNVIHHAKVRIGFLKLAKPEEQVIQVALHALTDKGTVGKELDVGRVPTGYGELAVAWAVSRAIARWRAKSRHAASAEETFGQDIK